MNRISVHTRFSLGRPAAATAAALLFGAMTLPAWAANPTLPTPYHASIVGSNGALTPFPIPTGCRLVIQAASVVIVDTALNPHVIFLTTGGASHFINLQQTAGVGQFIASGTLPIQLYVDSTLGVSMGDEIANPAANPPTYSISGYLLSLTPGASC